jgi:hypothetical protein
LANKKRKFFWIRCGSLAPTFPEILKDRYVFPTLIRPGGLRCRLCFQEGTGAGSEKPGGIAQAFGCDSGIAARSEALAGDGLQRNS